PEPLATPVRVAYLALLSGQESRDAGIDALAELCRRHGMARPAPGATHFSGRFPGFRLRWEQHTEFSRWMFIVDGPTMGPFATLALAAVPADWIAQLPGQLMVAAHAALIAGSVDGTDPDAAARCWFAGNMLVGAAVSGGAATALTDFRIHPDGFSRHL